eukprot:snap_masked-scaffold_21-processed-gene-1.28-mRNA-1 protein AED:1.00 eAED:1.00 QI:0/-1/0/0/-1/1/1/0/599
MEEVWKLREENGVLKKRVREKEDELRKLRARIQFLESRGKQGHVQVKEQHDFFQELQKSNANLRKRNRGLVEKVRVLQETLRRKEKILGNGTRAKLKKRINQVPRIQMLSEAANEVSTVEEILDCNKTTGRTVEEKKGKISLLKVRCEGLEIENYKLRERNEKFVTVISEANNSLKVHREEILNLESEVSKLKIELQIQQGVQKENKILRKLVEQEEKIMLPKREETSVFSEKKVYQTGIQVQVLDRGENMGERGDLENQVTHLQRAVNLQYKKNQDLLKRIGKGIRFEQEKKNLEKDVKELTSKLKTTEALLDVEKRLSAQLKKLKFDPLEKCKLMNEKVKLEKANEFLHEKILSEKKNINNQIIVRPCNKQMRKPPSEMIQGFISLSKLTFNPKFIEEYASPEVFLNFSFYIECKLNNLEQKTKSFEGMNLEVSHTFDVSMESYDNYISVAIILCSSELQASTKLNIQKQFDKQGKLVVKFMKHELRCPEETVPFCFVDLMLTFQQHSPEQVLDFEKERLLRNILVKEKERSHELEQDLQLNETFHTPSVSSDTSSLGSSFSSTSSIQSNPLDPQEEVVEVESSLESFFSETTEHSL